MVQAAPRVATVERDGGRAAVILAISHAVLFIASLLLIPLLAPSAKIPNPFGPDEPSRRFFLGNAFAIRWSDCLQLASAVCLAALACCWRGPFAESPAVRRATALTRAGGVGSSVLLVMAALTSWVLASPGTVDVGAAFRALQFLPFLMGGPGWAGFFALFLFGVATLSAGAVPRWMVWAGYALGTTSALATLVMVTLVAAPFLPLTRFLGFVWLIVATVMLRRRAGALVAAG